MEFRLQYRRDKFFDEEDKLFNNNDDVFGSYQRVILNAFEIDTYDEGMDTLFANSIVEVLKIIKDRTFVDYIKDEENYMRFVLVTLLLEREELVEVGVSIRAAWLTDEGLELYNLVNRLISGWNQ